MAGLVSFFRGFRGVAAGLEELSHSSSAPSSTGPDAAGGAFFRALPGSGLKLNGAGGPDLPGSGLKLNGAGGPDFPGNAAKLKTGGGLMLFGYGGSESLFLFRSSTNGAKLNGVGAGAVSFDVVLVCGMFVLFAFLLWTTWFRSHGGVFAVGSR